MGQGTVSVDREPQQLEAEIAELRDELGALIAELERRWHDALDIRRQLRRHAGPVVAAGIGVAITGVSLLWLRRRPGRRRNRLTTRASRLRQGIARLIQRPERVAAEPSVAGKLVTAAATAAAAMAASKAVDYLARRLVEGERRAPAPEPRSEAPPLSAA